MLAKSFKLKITTKLTDKVVDVMVDKVVVQIMKVAENSTFISHLKSSFKDGYTVREFTIEAKPPIIITQMKLDKVRDYSSELTDTTIEIIK